MNHRNIRNPNQQKLKKLSNVWQERFTELQLEENDFIYIDEELVFPAELKKAIFRSLQWGNAMLQAVADIRLLRIQRDIVLFAKS